MIASIRKIPIMTRTIFMVCVFLFFGSISVQQANRALFQTSQENQLLIEVSQIRAKIESSIAERVELLKGVVAIVSLEPELDQSRFQTLAHAMVSDQDAIQYVSLAPDLKVTMVYPFWEDNLILGKNLTDAPSLRGLINRARNSQTVQIAGPLELSSGGVGIVVNYPIFIDKGYANEKFWGMLSAVIELDYLFEDAGVTLASNIDFLITGKEGSDAQGQHFWGDVAVLEKEPLLIDVNLPSGSWQIAAVPADGWRDDPENALQMRIFEAFLMALILAPLLIVGSLLNDRSKDRTALTGVTRRLELALAASRIGVWEYDITNERLFWDDRMRKIYETPQDVPISYMNWQNALHADDLEGAIQEFNDAIENDLPYKSHFRLDFDGQQRHIRSIGTLYNDENGRRILIGVNWDTSEEVLRSLALENANNLAEVRNQELEEASRHIEHIALHDALTGLPNRRYLDEFVNSLIGADGKSFGFLHLDLDRFKQINDTMGHAAGDEMLMGVSEKLKKTVAQNDFVARIGGDEFVIVCQSETDRNGLERLSGEIIEQFRKPIMAGGRWVRCGTSIGITTSSSAPDNKQQLMINADVALYRAKKAGRNAFKYFTVTMHQEIVRNKRLADEVLNGIERGEFIAFYQPQVDAVSRQIVGVEALARWNHPTHGLLTPDHFLDVATDLNVLHKIDERMLDLSLEQMKIWHEDGVKPPRVAVNVSGRRLADNGLLNSLAKRDFNPKELAFELVESTFLDQQDEVVAHNLDRIRDLGITIEIDDFGTGYASIVSLMGLHPHRLKIDRQLTSTIGPDDQSQQLVRSIVEMAHALDIDVLAEGVETLEQADILEKLGCSSFQGYAFARPMSGKAFVEYATKVALATRAA